MADAWSAEPPTWPWISLFSSSFYSGGHVLHSVYLPLVISTPMVSIPSLILSIPKSTALALTSFLPLLGVCREAGQVVVPIMFNLAFFFLPPFPFFFFLNVACYSSPFILENPLKSLSPWWPRLEIPSFLVPFIFSYFWSLPLPHPRYRPVI